ncbi:MAG: LPP20 family lipoprotein, partial [Spirochaetales bacterium]|nr:LPP20 family lipoprotein [Spirochaetales bacterium]
MLKIRNKTCIKAFGLVAIIITVLNSCVSTEPAPDWVTNPPTNNAYYIGIGGSNSGDKAEDNEIAKRRAMSALAAEISAVISSESTYKTTADSLGNINDSAEEVITQLVNQNLKAVEIVDVWSSVSSGYWYYLRLN